MLILALLACAADPDLPTEGELSLLTYNVKGLPPEITGDDTGARMDAISPMLDAYDIVGLQEDFAEDFHARLLAEASHPTERWFSATVDEDRVYGSGLSLLARDPEEDYLEQHYTACHGVLDGASDCLASKGFHAVRLTLGAGTLDVYNTHHEAGGGEEDEAARASQVDEVIAAMDSFSAGRAVVLLGDTNLRPSDPPDAELLARYAAAGLRDACVELDCPEPDHIDRFLIRDGDEVALTLQSWSRETHFVDGAGTDLSDHPALAIALAWATSTAAD